MYHKIFMKCKNCFFFSSLSLSIGSSLFLNRFLMNDSCRVNEKSVESPKCLYRLLTGANSLLEHHHVSGQLPWLYCHYKSTSWLNSKFSMPINLPLTRLLLSKTSLIKHQIWRKISVIDPVHLWQLTLQHISIERPLIYQLLTDRTLRLPPALILILHFPLR